MLPYNCFPLSHACGSRPFASSACLHDMAARNVLPTATNCCNKAVRDAALPTGGRLAPCGSSRTKCGRAALVSLPAPDAGSGAQGRFGRLRIRPLGEGRISPKTGTKAAAAALLVERAARNS